MLILKPNKIPSSEITPESVYLNRRRFMQAFAGMGLAAAAMPASALTTTSMSLVQRSQIRSRRLRISIRTHGRLR